MQLRQPQPRYHRTQQYSITALTDSSGNITERYAYSAYGTPTITDAAGSTLTSSADNNRYTYTGREWDEVLSLYHFRARMYDSISGRFLSRDPKNFGDGFSVYRNYFSMNALDPTGELIFLAIPLAPVLVVGGVLVTGIVVTSILVETEVIDNPFPTTLDFPPADYPVNIRPDAEPRPIPPRRPRPDPPQQPKPTGPSGGPPPVGDDRDCDDKDRCPKGECWCCDVDYDGGGATSGSGEGVTENCGCRDAAECLEASGWDEAYCFPYGTPDGERLSRTPVDPIFHPRN